MKIINTFHFPCLFAERKLFILYIIWTDQKALEGKDFWTEEHSTTQNGFFP